MFKILNLISRRIIILSCSLIFYTQAEVLETMNLTAKVISVSGPTEPTGSEIQFYCRDLGPVGLIEDVGISSFNFDASSRTVNFYGFILNANEILGDDASEHRVISVSFKEVYPAVATAKDFVEVESELINGRWDNTRIPSFTGVYRKNYAYTYIPTGQSISCTETYKVYGGVGKFAGEFEDNRDVSLINRFWNSVRTYIYNRSKSKNALPVTNKTVVFGVRG